ncbi:hypothetical protein ES705_28136 [subsurface metagenome]
MKLESDETIESIAKEFGGKNSAQLTMTLRILRTQVKNEVLGKANNAIKLIQIMYR